MVDIQCAVFDGQVLATARLTMRLGNGKENFRGMMSYLDVPHCLPAIFVGIF